MENIKELNPMFEIISTVKKNLYYRKAHSVRIHRMTTVVLLTIFFNLSGSLLLSAEKPVVRLLKNTQFDVPVIQWLWRTDKNERPYPYVRVQSHQVSFLNSALQTLTSHPILPGSRIVESPNHNYVAAVVLDSLSSGSQPEKWTSFQVFDDAGIQVAFIQRKLCYDDGIPQALIQNDGTLILLDAGLQQLSLYNLGGELLKTIDLFDENVFAYEKPLNGVISSDGKHIAIIGQRRPATINAQTNAAVSGEPQVFLLDSYCSELWRAPLPGAHAGQVAIVEDPFTVIASSYTADADGRIEKYTTFFDRQGTMLLFVPMLFENALKSAKSLYLANKHELWRVDFPSEKVLWKWQAPAERLIIKILETDQDVLVLMAQNEFKNGRFEYYAPSLACLSKSGAAKGTQNLGDMRFIRPSINFHHDFRIIILGCKFGFSTFEVLR